MVGQRRGQNRHGRILAVRSAARRNNPIRDVSRHGTTMPPTSGTTSLPLDAPLPRKTRAFIVLVALLQGGPLSLAALGQQHGMWPFTELGARICWYTLVMTIPGVALLRAQDLRDWPLFQHVAASTLVFTALGSWAAWTATGAPALNLIPVLWSFGFTVSLGWFVALPWLQHRQLRGHWRAGYRDLFEHAWQNALALLCVCVCWMVPGLWVSLFALVKIQAFRDLFREQTRIWSFCLSTTVGAAIRPCSRCAPPPPLPAAPRASSSWNSDWHVPVAGTGLNPQKIKRTDR
ncbi:hypothetical protein DXO246_18430 [Xanthomonas oryzae pv. oryzae]|uniref:Uncharacterized protein n=1 Tax=Xanthomonas oryzae pv. oryzae (strain PXO99A) TaxID=360094 RepID=A0A0K0GN98_XANOP|nr:hypothetical protein PXO_01999 [Xanthomonas oryzae pv. oryzae PXO99A]OLH17506.1 hypothetical protein DXO015_06150 [Xanthomonas oryzae pv. oryzae]OLH67318.1 hypothetical protein DXO200_13250 [Xanthomonas oryzae pv. oryzae]OLH96891.1 hypothetical protein DXO246_18430 [Xanthomonas oryzae pv. oryzae]OLI16166.1 hypothetical protein DXO242_09195 [Xanthomonas oryzae pv. oryzae]